MALPNGRRRATIIAVVCIVSLLTAGVGAVSTETTTTESASGIEPAAAPNAGGQEESTISIENFSAPEQVELGTDFTVTAEITNQGDEQAVPRVSYRISGNVLQFEILSIPPNSTETVQFNVSELDTDGFPPGTYTHGVFAGDAQATANLTLTADAGTPTPEEEETPTVEETPDEETPTPSEAETPTPEPSAANVTFENQTSNGTTVTVESVTVPRGGFVVIHDESIIEGAVIDSMVGESEFLDAGTHQNVTIQLDESLNESQRLVAVVYRDSNDNQEYDFVTSNRTADGPYTRPDSREAVNEIAFIDVEEE